MNGYEGLYQVSNLGRVKSLNNSKKKKEKILNNNNYHIVNLSKNGVTTSIKIHRIVAKAFVENPDNLSCVYHKDNNKLNNCANNLRWGAYEGNIARGISKRKSVKCIETGIVYNSLIEASKQTGANKTAICRVCNNKRYMAGGYHWEYINKNNLEKS